uniref:SAM-dependent MTase TRM10-type domain-containing protein n=1 Tax=Steinernema glaseri TaxID=37863 RepID=A0A1I8AFR4_9BILA
MIDHPQRCDAPSFVAEMEGGGVAFLESLFEEFSIEKPREAERVAKSEKREVRYRKVVERRKLKRVEEHRRRRERKKEARDDAENNAEMKRLSVCIDLAFCSAMNSKERGKLIRQLGRVWGLQKRYPGLATTLVNLEDSVKTEGERIVSGFGSFSWKTTSERLEDVQSTSSLVYLSPDAEMEPLMAVEEEAVYVIGGLVDESGKGSMSREKAEALGVRCRRLPIPEFMTKTSSGTFNVMLTINQVVEILCRFATSGDWTDALEPVVPARTGYTVAKT